MKGITPDLRCGLFLGGVIFVCLSLHVVWPAEWQRWLQSGVSAEPTHLIRKLAGSSIQSTIQDSAQDAERLLLLQVGSAAPNSRGRLPVALNSLGDENAVSFSLNFDPAALSDPRVELGSEYSDAFLEIDDSEVDEGRLGILMILTDGGIFQAGVRRILEVSFAVSPEAGAGLQPVELGDAPLPRSITNEDGDDLPARFGDGAILVLPGIEADVAPQPVGAEDGEITETDLHRIGLFAVGVATPDIGSEFLRADCAPMAGKGDGRITVADWVQAIRFSNRSDEPVAAGGPSAPVNFDQEPVTGCDGDSSQRALRANDAEFVRGEENRIEIELEAHGDENAIGFTLSFDPTHLEFAGAVAGDDAESAEMNLNLERAAQGIIGVALVLPGGQTFPAGLRKILSVDFKVQPTGPVNQTTVSLDDSLAVREIVDASAAALCANFISAVVDLTPEVNEPPTLTSLDPPVFFAGATDLNLSINGAGFVSTSVVLVNGEIREATLIDNNQLLVSLLPEDVAGVGIIVITVFNPGDGGGVSAPLELFVVQRAPGDNARPTLSLITPNQVAAGRLPFTLTLSGVGFAQDCIVRIKGQDRKPRFINDGKLEVEILAADVAAAGEVPVQVFNPPPGGGLSNELRLGVRKLNPIPRVTSLSLEEKTSGGFTLMINGTNFVAGATVTVNGVPRTPTTANSSRMTIDFSTQQILALGATLVVIVTNPPLGGGKSFPVSLAISGLGLPPNRAPSVFSLAPSMAPVGNIGFLLRVNGSGFLPGAVVFLNGRALITNFVSASQLSAQIHSSDLARPARLEIRVINPDSGAERSSPLTLEVRAVNPDPRISNVAFAPAGQGQTSNQLVVTGSNFIPASTGRVNGSSRSTTFVNNTTLRITLSTQDLSVAGTLAITVFNPALGGGVSNVVEIVIDNPVVTVNPSPPSISDLRPNLVGAGSPVLTLIVNGSNFRVSSVVRFNGNARATTFVSTRRLTAIIFSSDLALPGGFPIEVFTPGADGGRSSSLTLSVRKRNPVPQIAGVSPETVNSGGRDFQLTVSGSNFVNGSKIRVNGSVRQTSFVSSGELKATILQSDISQRRQLNISVLTDQPGGGVSAQLPLLVGDPVNLQPSISGVTPNLVGEGGAAFKLKVAGMRFMPGSVVRLDNVARATTFVSSTQLTAAIPAADLMRARTFSVQVFNQEPGGGLSGSASLEVRKRNLLPRILSLSTDLVNAGEAGFTLILNGSNFARNASVRVKGVLSATASTRTPTFINSSQLTISILGQDILRAGTVNISVNNPAPGGGNSNVMTIRVQ